MQITDPNSQSKIYQYVNPNFRYHSIYITFLPAMQYSATQWWLCLRSWLFGTTNALSTKRQKIGFWTNRGWNRFSGVAIALSTSIRHTSLPDRPRGHCGSTWKEVSTLRKWHFWLTKNASISVKLLVSEISRTLPCREFNTPQYHMAPKSLIKPTLARI